jgi:hypothetical protein
MTASLFTAAGSVVRANIAKAFVRFLTLLVLWCILLALSWPLALAVMILAPVVWLIALPFRIVGVCVGAVIALLKTLLFLPARVLGYRS